MLGEYLRQKTKTDEDLHEPSWEDKTLPGMCHQIKEVADMKSYQFVTYSCLLFYCIHTSSSLPFATPAKQTHQLLVLPIMPTEAVDSYWTVARLSCVMRDFPELIFCLSAQFHHYVSPTTLLLPAPG